MKLVERERWDGEVVATDTGTVTWGTHTFAWRFQAFADGEGHVQVIAPSDPPPAAAKIVADLRASDDRTEQTIGAVLADRWPQVFFPEESDDSDAETTL